jgi:hypothetical protein
MSLPQRRVIQNLICIQILLLLFFSEQASAQEGAPVRLAPIETEEFPHISSYLDVRTAEDGFVFDLDSSDIRIIEDGTRLPVSDLALLHSGSQFVLAVSPGPAFDIRDVQGLTRYNYLSQALVDWAGARSGSTVDDLSIVTELSTLLPTQPRILGWVAQFFLSPRYRSRMYRLDCRVWRLAPASKE